MSADQRRALRGMAVIYTAIVAAFALLFALPLTLGTLNALFRGSVLLLDLVMAVVALGLMAVIGMPFARVIVALYRDLRADEVVKDCGLLGFDNRLSPLTRLLGSRSVYVTLDGARRYRSMGPLAARAGSRVCLYVARYSGLILSIEG